MQLLGFLDSIGDWIMGLFNLIPKFIYFLCVTLMSLIDALQYVLRKLAGMDTYYINGVEQNGDIVMSFIQSIFVKDSPFPAIKNAFWALVIFGVMLLIVATIIAVIRQEYMPSVEDMKDRPSNSKFSVIGRSVKSLFLFLIVPVSCLFGLMLSDVILYGLDTITSANTGSTLMSVNVINTLQTSQTASGKETYVHYDMFGAHKPTTTTTFSGSMFKTAAYESNRVRLNESYSVGISSTDTYYNYLQEGSIMNFGFMNQGNTQEECAQIIDEAFANCVRLKTPGHMDINGGPLDGVVDGNLTFALRDGAKVEYFSKFNVGLVFYYYNLWYFNFLIGFAFLIVSLKLFFNIVMALMKRIVEMVALFIVSPPIIAVMPLDGGKAFTNWRQSFVSKALSAYGAIIGMNLFFLILPYFNTINLFDPTVKVFNILNMLFSCLFIIVGLSTVQGFITLLGGLIGGEDLVKSGTELSSKVGENLGKSAKMTGAAAGLAFKGASLPVALTGKAVTGITNKVGRSVAQRRGDANWENWSVQDKAKQGLTNLKSKMFTSQKSARKYGTQFGQQWNDGGAQKAYDQYIDDSSSFKDAMANEYIGRSDKHKDMDRTTWETTTAEGMRARERAKVTAGLPDFQTFKSQINVDKEGHITGEVEGSAGSRIFREKLSDYVRDVSKQSRKQTMQSILKNVSNFGGRNIAALSTIYFDNVKDGFVSGGKGGFMSMMKAFNGLSAKQIEQGELIKKFQKEEAAKTRAQEKERAKLAQNSNNNTNKK